MLTIIRLVILSFTFYLIASLFFFGLKNSIDSDLSIDRLLIEDSGGPAVDVHPLSIQSLRNGEYPGSDMIVEQTLSPGSNYQRYISSYKSEGLKIYGLLTIPNGQSPNEGWPAVLFNHGYISPSVYKTTEKYIAYQDAFARNGYVTFKSDYRGHGNSDGRAEGGYGSNAYTIDVLNATSSIKRLKNPNNSLEEIIVNPNRLGMWGHSMGGSITLKAMVSVSDIKAGVIWAGVVGSYSDLVGRWKKRQAPSPTINLLSQRGRWRMELVEKYGEPDENPEFWNSLSANNYLSDISGPIQLHHGTADTSVPVYFSQELEKQMISAGKRVELYLYEGDDHNLSKNLSLALNRSVEFFDKHLK